MNDLQKKEFEILKTFIEICEKLNLTYYLVCGSALGAIKYQGFIPWDDDIDVALPRKDYEIFLSEAQNLLPEYLFLQNYRTEKNYPLLITKLRDSRTTLIETDFAHLDIHHGISIDIFPLDGYPQGKIAAAKFEKRKKYFQRRQFVGVAARRGSWWNLRSTAIWVLYRLFGYCKDVSRVMQKYDEFLASFPIEGSQFICNHANWQGRLEYAPAEQYGDGAIATFENLSVRVPAQYDAYLQQKYGDYTQDPPKNKQISHHSYTVVDVEMPYTAYTKKHSMSK